MRSTLLTAIFAIGILIPFRRGMAQDSTNFVSSLTRFPSKFLGQVNKKANDLNKQLDNQTEKYLNKLSQP